MARDAREARTEPAPRRARRLAALALVAAAALGAAALWRGPADEADAQEKAAPAASLERLLPHWGKPDLVLLLSGQQHGYLQPCGCSRPQFGGLSRRSNFVGLLRRAGWPVLALDLGDIAQRGGLQTMAKYVTSMKALTAMDYRAVGVGENEMALPLLNALGHYRLNNPSPRVLAASLQNKGKDQAFHDLVEDGKVFGGRGRPTVGVIGLVGTSVIRGVKEHVKDPDLQFEAGVTVLPRVLRAVRAHKPDLLVLLYQGSAREARLLAGKVPNFDVILCLSAEEEPPSLPERVGKTFVVTVGHKGRYVGVVGAYRTGRPEKPFELRYQLVSLGEDLDTPPGQEAGNKVLALLEDYAREVKRDGYLARAALQRVPHRVQLAFPRSTYVGSQECRKCHGAAYKVWKASPHAHAYEALAQARRPSLRQYDSECIGCHVTGWGHRGGFESETKTPLLKDNGCENCHGPASEHVRLQKLANPTAQELKDRQKVRDLINPFRFDPREKAAHARPEDREKWAAARARRLNLLDYSCQKCHDIENDVKWNRDKWWKIVHSDDRR